MTLTVGFQFQQTYVLFIIKADASESRNPYLYLLLSILYLEI